MKIKYYGKSEIGMRCAEFTYKDKEEEKFYEIQEYVEEKYGFEIFNVGVSDDDVNIVYVEVEDKYEFEELKNAWKEAKMALA